MGRGRGQERSAEVHAEHEAAQAQDLPPSEDQGGSSAQAAADVGTAAATAAAEVNAEPQAEDTPVPPPIPGDVDLGEVQDVIDRAASDASAMGNDFRQGDV